MSKIRAYKCDHCDNIVEDEYVFGLLPTVDLFDKLASYPSANPEKADIHYCIFCVRQFVLNPLEKEFPHRKTKELEQLYALKMKELSYSLRSSTIDRYRNFAIAHPKKKG